MSIIRNYLKNENEEKLTNKEIISLFELYRNKCDLDARDKIYDHNINLVFFTIDFYNLNNTNNNDIDEVISSGTLGLLKAIENFDYTKNYKFSSYAVKTIKNQILYYFRKQKKYNKENSLDNFISNDQENDHTFNEMLKDQINYEEVACKKIDFEFLIKTLFSNCNEQEKMILSYKFGLNNNPVLTRKEISNTLRIDYRKIRSIENRLLRSIDLKRIL